MLLVALRSYAIRIGFRTVHLLNVLGIDLHASVGQDEASKGANDFVVFSRGDKRHRNQMKCGLQKKGVEVGYTRRLCPVMSRIRVIRGERRRLRLLCVYSMEVNPFEVGRGRGRMRWKGEMGVGMDVIDACYRENRSQKGKAPWQNHYSFSTCDTHFVAALLSLGEQNGV